MERKLEAEFIARLSNHSCNNKEIVTVAFECSYDQIVETMKIIALINNDINLSFTKPSMNGDIIDLGYYRFDKLTYANDGSSKIVFKGVLEKPGGTGYAKMDNVNMIRSVDSNIEELKLFLSAVIDTEDEETEQEVLEIDEWENAPVLDDETSAAVNDEWGEVLEENVADFTIASSWGTISEEPVDIDGIFDDGMVTDDWSNVGNWETQETPTTDDEWLEILEGE